MMAGISGRRIACAATAAVAALSVAGAAFAQTPLYRDPAAPMEQRVEDLLSRMTLEEKIAQIVTVWQQKPQLLQRRQCPGDQLAQ